MASHATVISIKDKLKEEGFTVSQSRVETGSSPQALPPHTCYRCPPENPHAVLELPQHPSPYVKELRHVQRPSTPNPIEAYVEQTKKMLKVVSQCLHPLVAPDWIRNPANYSKDNVDKETTAAYDAVCAWYFQTETIDGIPLGGRQTPSLHIAAQTVLAYKLVNRINYFRYLAELSSKNHFSEKKTPRHLVLTSKVAMFD